MTPLANDRNETLLRFDGWLDECHTRSIHLGDLIERPDLFRVGWIG